MSALSIQVPFPVFQDRDGQPLENGYVWIGVANLNPQTNPVVAYYDSALTIVAPQPLRTLNGYISRAGTPAQIYVDAANYSILVQDSKGSMVYNFPNGTGIGPDACGVTYNPPFTGAVPYPVCEKLEQVVSVMDFGATCDGVTDDSAAVQAAVNYCLTFNGAKSLLVPGKCRLASSIIINRLVDSTTTRFRIIAEGSDAGFYTTTNVVMFDTTLPVTTDPQSENISFEGVTFSTDNNTRNTYVLAAGKFLRMQFINCDFQLIRCMYSLSVYAQTYHFYQCRARYWLDTFFQSDGTYDFHAEFDMKGGGDGFRFVSATRPVLRADLTNGTWEGCSGSYITAGNASGLTIANNYIEYNGSVALNFDAGYASSSITVNGNIFVQTAPQIADPNFFDIQWGETTRAVSFGNYCNGRLHNTSKIVGANRLLTISGDVADVELYKGFGSNLFDPARSAVGNVSLTVNNRQVLSIGNNWTGIDADFGGTNLGPGVVQGGAYIPIRLISGTQNPGVNNAFYGNPYWTAGSVVTNSAPAVGSPKGWVCTVNGQPGTWVSQGNL
jgi:hypothetical protein